MRIQLPSTIRPYHHRTGLYRWLRRALCARLETTGEKRMKLRYAGICRLCGTELPARTEAVYERSTKTVRCLDAPPRN